MNAHLVSRSFYFRNTYLHETVVFTSLQKRKIKTLAKYAVSSIAKLIDAYLILDISSKTISYVLMFPLGVQSFSEHKSLR